MQKSRNTVFILYLIYNISDFELTVYLVNHHRPAEAAEVLLEYTSDVEEAIVTLIAGQQWSEAQRVVGDGGMGMHEMV